MSKGLPLDQDRTAMIGLAHILRKKLLEKNNPDKIIEAAQIAAEVFETSLSENPPDKLLDCKKGCNYCCARLVGVSALEAFWVADQISNSVGEFLKPDDYFDRATRTIGVDPGARGEDQTLCALLHEDACAIYSARPLVCRANASHSVQACLAAFQGEDSNIPAPHVHLFIGDRCRMAIYAALRSLNYPAVSYELSEAVSVILREEKASERLYEGEDIFAGVQAPTDRNANMDAVITDISRAIAF